ncbi:uncharacterized protein LOC110451519 [Mizuhopecten yessoensis]|uniref:Saposin B-type domain-containing protein n=1 Tax=Mizuhopecten yessoensis TaxID=6573 RepID=A0A210QLG2_MIZYE|nr:uncharacterized protein LOC110451519 [Mizuhopecten yessoensis]OWF49579.1 hypothetical protein KP79_PYT06341 [Mizuhopecten yessoensis]
MENMYKILVIFVAVCFAKAHDPLPEDLSEEMYCAGCKATVKELGRALQYHTSEKMEKRVSDLLGQVCDEERFLSYEYSVKKLVKACEHLVQNHQDDLVPLLRDYYSKKSRKGHSYLHIAHIVCNKETFACGGGEEEGEEDPKKGKVIYNDDTDDFDIHFGDNVKMVKPVREFDSPKRDEL